MPLGITLKVSRNDSCYDFELKSGAPFTETTETKRVCDSEMDNGKEFGYRADFRPFDNGDTGCLEHQIPIRYQFGESDGNGGIKSSGRDEDYLCYDLDIGDNGAGWTCNINTIVSGVLDRLVCKKGEDTRRFELFEADASKATERLVCDITGLGDDDWPTNGVLETDIGDIERVVYEYHLYDTDDGVAGLESDNQYKWVRLGINGLDEAPRLYSKVNPNTTFLYSQGVGVARGYGEILEDTEGFFVGRVTEDDEGAEIFDVVFIDIAALQSDGIDDEDDVDTESQGIYGIVLLGVEDHCEFSQPTSD
ncbi:MAG: hypothetical protein LAT62_06405 [Natronospirillum sp.]|uniref:hypothetical protein n=1 Tax=Natronospirillum sp. TaxID=2812955 RepID=UPI0025E8567F|nr:hypothetical protein [Natronospirillum sp.]MCH8551548.1 hypothetical protein [Natronospirillum sp.]